MSTGVLQATVKSPPLIPRDTVIPSASRSFDTTLVKDGPFLNNEIGANIG